jgi:hypothetical protein
MEAAVHKRIREDMSLQAKNNEGTLKTNYDEMEF